MRKAVAIMDESLHDAVAFVAADLSFHHSALATATQNTLITLLLESIEDHLQDQRKTIFLVKDGAARGQYHHKQILGAVIQGNSEDARDAVRAHLQQIRMDSEAANQVMDEAR